MEKLSNKKTYKDKLAVWTASSSFILSWVLTIINFFLEPMGEVSDSTLWILAQALFYCSAVIGLTSYVNKQIDSKLKLIQ